MRGLALGLAVSLAACAAPADTVRMEAPPDEVILGGWAIPDGAAVCGEMKLRTQTAFDLADEPGFELRSQGVVAGCTRDFVVGDDGEVTRAVMTIDRWDMTSEEWQDGQRLSSGKDRYELLGDAVLYERTETGGWDLSLETGTPTPEQANLLPSDSRMELDGSEYPAYPVAVGDAWDVPLSVIAQSLGPLAPDVQPRFQMRLDSVSVTDGVVFAHISGEMSATTVSPPDIRTEVTRRVRRIRRLDVLLDVWCEVDRTARAVKEPTSEAGPAGYEAQYRATLVRTLVFD